MGNRNFEKLFYVDSYLVFFINKPERALDRWELLTPSQTRVPVRSNISLRDPKWEIVKGGVLTNTSPIYISFFGVEGQEVTARSVGVSFDRKYTGEYPFIVKELEEPIMQTIPNVSVIEKGKLRFG